MSLIVNNNTIQKLIVNGVEIKKLRVKRASDSTYTVVFEAGGETYTGSFDYQVLCDLYNRYNDGKLDSTESKGALTELWSEYAKGVCPLVQAGYVQASQEDFGQDFINYAGVLDFENQDCSSINLQERGHLRVFSPCDAFLTDGGINGLAELALVKRDDPITANLQNLLFDNMAVFNTATNKYKLNPRWFSDADSLESCSEVTISEDYCSYTFSISGGTVSVGTANITAGDGTAFSFAAGIKQFIDKVYYPVIAQWNNGISMKRWQPNTLLFEKLRGGDGLEVPDERTIVFNFSEPVLPDDLAIALSYIQAINPDDTSIADSYLNGNYNLNSLREGESTLVLGKYTYSNSGTLDNNLVYITLAKNSLNDEHTPDAITFYFLEVPINSPATNIYYDEDFQAIAGNPIASTNDFIDLAIYNTKTVPIRNFTIDAPYIYESRPQRVYYLTIKNSGYDSNYESELTSKVDYVAYLNALINPRDSVNGILKAVLNNGILTSRSSGTDIKCFHEVSPYFLQVIPDDAGIINSVTALNKNLPEITNKYPLSFTELTFSGIGSYPGIAEYIRQKISPSDYPSEVLWGLTLNEVGNTVDASEAYYYDETKYHIASYLFESGDPRPDKLLLANYLGFLVNNDNSLSIKKGEYTPA